tara:strand:- start:809 stop:1123 length:315 start_codon:yes stop_codon:yes gene_type:complete
MVLKRLKKLGLKIKKGWQSDANPIQGQLNKQANIGNVDKSQKATAGGRIQKKLIEKGGFQASDLRRKTEAHKAWKIAKKAGKLKEWEKKYHPDRIKAGQSRYGN